MKLSHKIILSLTACVAVVLVFWFIRFFMAKHLESYNHSSEQIAELTHRSLLLDQEVNKLRFSTFPNYDRLNQYIDNWGHSYQGLTKAFNEDPDHHARSKSSLVKLNVAFLGAESLFRDFQSLHSTLRNSSIYIPNLAQKIVLEPEHRYLAPQILVVDDEISLAISLHRVSELAKLAEAVSQLEQMSGNQQYSGQLLSSYLAHTEIFIRVFPQYLDVNLQLEEHTQQLITTLNQIKEQYRGEEKIASERTQSLAWLLFAFLVLGESLVIYLLIKNHNSTITDRLTGLKNRLSFQSQVETLNQPELILVNLDRFKHTNNFFGIEAGDLVLQQLAQRLKQGFEGQAEVFRISGDEFSLLFDQVGLAGLEKASLKVQSLVAAPFVYKDLQIQVDVSLVLIDQRPLLTNANMLMSHLRDQDEVRVMAYSEHLGLEKRVSDNFKMLEKLKKAIAEDRIQPVFQPIFDAKSLKPVKFECLIRLVEEDGKLLSPFFFLGVAKQANLYKRLTEIMVDKCFARFVDQPYGFSINLSAQDITDPVLGKNLLSRLEANPELASRTTFEILESEGIDNFDLVQEFITKVKNLGAKIAIDDFGAGYSNFENILKLQVDYLKIDGSLIERIDEDINSERVTRSIIWFAREIGIETVVEFVHSQAVQDKVIELGADLLQGFHLGEPKITFS